MAQINSASVNAPGANARRISEVNSGDMARTEWNGVDIRDPWRKFTDDEWFTKLGGRGQELVRAKRRNNSGRGHGGHGRGGRGRGGRGRGYQGRGRAWNNNGGRGEQSQNNDRNERSVNETSTGDRTTAPEGNTGGNVPSTVTTSSNSQASTSGNKGGQNGNRFGTNRP